MPPTPTVVQLTELLIELSKEMCDQQTRLDCDNRERISAYLPLLAYARAAGFETFVQQLAPAAMVLGDSELTMQFRFAGSVEQQAALKVQLLDLGFRRRYAHSDFAQNSLQVNLVRIPWTAAPNPKPKPLV
jgi:hypothetical protein